MSSRFSTYLLDEIIRSKKNETEQTRLRLVEHLFVLLDKLALEVGFEEAYLFGSVTRPYCFAKHSDIDVGFLGLKDKDFFKVIAFLSRELEADVDVVQLEGHRLAEKVEKEGIRWKRKE